MRKRMQQKEQMSKVKLNQKELSQIVGGRFMSPEPKPSNEPIIDL